MVSEKYLKRVQNRVTNVRGKPLRVRGVRAVRDFLSERVRKCPSMSERVRACT